MALDINTLTIRRAKAEDADAAVPLIYSSGPEVWDLLFGDGSAESSLPYLRAEWMNGGGVAGYETHWLAELDGQVLGAVSVYSRGGHKALGSQTVRHGLRYYGLRLLPRIPNLLKMGKHLMHAPKADVDYVANFGVAPAARGKGIGAAMLQHFLERAKQRGKRQYELDVMISNPRGQQLYERFGMSVLQENLYPPFEKYGISGARRMGMLVK